MANLGPGSKARGTATGRPIMVLLDLLGRRWALRIIWELREGPQTFRGLRERCDAVSPSVLNTRLRELRAAGIIANEGKGGYELSDEGRTLLEALEPLHFWAAGWAKRTG
jgi:DNA-binding HxlR family transcriptional regulator